MKTGIGLRWFLPLLALVSPVGRSALSAEAPLTGPETEKRFPPLKVPAGFKATLFACDPLIEYPSVIALGPRPATVFVAHDYMTGLGFEIVRRDEVRLVEDVDGDGYADKSTVFADGFNSIEGLAFHAGAVHVMHSPFLTVLRDADGDGVADERRDLLSGLGLPPEANPPRLHCANGVVRGHDGWLYLALGDHGCDVLRPEGDRLIFHGGGILRCRDDGRDLHLFASGLRNIYDLALDDELNVFVRDNENDGGSYKVRVYHSFFGADHGYPWRYYERPAEALPPLADLGLGSSAGGVCYLEPAFPAEFRGNLLFCEWGRSVVRYARDRAGSSFAPMKEIEFGAGAENDPYGFKPTDIVVDRDGSLLVSDWADGQRPKRGRGRIYRIRHEDQPSTNPPEPAQKSVSNWIAQLNSPSYHRRTEAQAAIEQQGIFDLGFLEQAMESAKVEVPGRLHAVWILASIQSRASVDRLFDLAENDADVRVRAQAIRALADLCDPVLVEHRLAAGPGDSALAARIAALGNSADQRVRLEVILALGRMQWPGTPDWLRENLKQPDAALEHAAMHALRRSKNWPAVLALVDLPESAPARGIALRALAEQPEAAIVRELRRRLGSDPGPLRRTEYADALTRVHRLPGPWVYWDYRPGPRPANTISWEQTEAIEQALHAALADADRRVRTLTLRRMQAEKIPVRIESLDHWLRSERDSETVTDLIAALRDRPPEALRELLESVIRDPSHSTKNRLAALELFVHGLGASSEERLLELASAIDDGPVLAESLRQLGTRARLSSRPLVRSKLASFSPEVRAAALESMAVLQDRQETDAVSRLLLDPDSRVRQAAARTSGRLAIREAVDALMLLAKDPHPLVRRESLEALFRLAEPRVVSLAQAALQDGPSQVVALECLETLGGPAQLEAVGAIASKSHSQDVLHAAVRVLNRWQQNEGADAPVRLRLDEAIAAMHGSSGLLLHWQVSGPHPPEEAARVLSDWAKPPPGRTVQIASGTEAHVELDSKAAVDADAVWLAFAEVSVPEPTDVQFLGSGAGTFRVWLNGHSVHQRAGTGRFLPDSDRFDARLERGRNRLIVQVPAPRDARFHLRFRRKSSNADHERLTQLALTTTGNAARGREVLLNAEKSLCLKCHLLGDQGTQAGPELTGLGGRFSRIHIIESILDPSRTIAPSFESLIVELNDGTESAGVKVAESRDTLTLGDLQGHHEIRKETIRSMRPFALSFMPAGLEKALSETEFVDLIAFLTEQK